MINKNLLEKTILYYEKLKHFDFVVTPSLPILYFGDLKKYMASNLRIITVGKNPSDNEFRLNKKEKYSFVRFPNWNNNHEKLTDVLSEYFECNPLKNWFSCYEPILNGISASYYSKNGIHTAIHTDICSPLATAPTWSKLSNEKKQLLFQEGHLIWIDLIEELQPDLILVSIPRELFNSIFKNKTNLFLSFKEKKDGTPRKKTYTVEETEYFFKNGKKARVIFGQAANKPFDTISENQKINLGKQCLK